MTIFVTKDVYYGKYYILSLKTNLVTIIVIARSSF